MIDLHTHLGGAVPASVLWEILCDTGLQTEFCDFDALHDFLTVGRGDIKNLDEFLSRYFHATEMIQSSPQAASVAAYQAVSKAFRRAHITGMEIRYNPLKRLRKGQHSLDAIVLASIQGLQKVSMHYKVSTGIVFSMGKELSLKENAKIIEAAIRFSKYGVIHGSHGVVGVDMAGPESSGRDLDVEFLKEMGLLLEDAKKAKLGVTWHVGETGHTGPNGIENILKYIQPNRIGHGIQLRNAKGKQLQRLTGMIKENNVLLEICPTVNVVTKSISSYAKMADFLIMLDDLKVPFCLNTDNPYIIQTNLKKEYDIMEEALGNGFSLRKKCKKFMESATFLKEAK